MKLTKETIALKRSAKYLFLKTYIETKKVDLNFCMTITFQYVRIIKNTKQTKKTQNSNVLALNLYDRGIYFQEVQNVK